MSHLFKQEMDAKERSLRTGLLSEILTLGGARGNRRKFDFPNAKAPIRASFHTFNQKSEKQK